MIHSPLIQKCLVITKTGKVLINVSHPSHFDSFDTKTDVKTIVTTILGFQQFSQHSKLSTIRTNKFSILICDNGSICVCFVLSKEKAKMDSMERKKNHLREIYGRFNGVNRFKCIQICELLQKYYLVQILDIIEKDVKEKEKLSHEFVYSHKKYEMEEEMKEFEIIPSLKMFIKFEKYIIIPMMNVEGLGGDWYVKMSELKGVLKIIVLERNYHEILLQYSCNSHDTSEFIKAMVECHVLKTTSKRYKRSLSMNQMSDDDDDDDDVLKIEKVNELIMLYSFDFSYSEKDNFVLKFLCYVEHKKVNGKFENTMVNLRREIMEEFPCSKKEYEKFVCEKNSKLKEIEIPKLENPKMFVRKKRIHDAIVIIE